MPPLTLTYRTDALRCLTIGGGLSVCAVSGSEPMEQRAQSDACIGFAESRQRKTKGQNCPPHATGGKGLKTDEIGARVAGNQKARPVSHLRGADVPSRVHCFPDGKRV